MNRFFLFLVIIVLGLLLDCKKIYEAYDKNVSGVTLTDELIEKYIKAVRSLHKLGPSIPQKLAEKGESEATGIDLYHEIDNVIKEAGFKDYFEFVKVNAKVAWAWNISQGELGIQKFQGMKDEGLKQIEETLANPEVPEETKKELRKARQEIIDTWMHNKKYADISMNIVKPLTNEHDLEIIKRHHKEIMEAYTGLPQEKLQDIDFNVFINGVK
jgi:hypothetical protein